MSRLVGRVHFNATLDGKSIPGDARRAGRQAGEAGGKEFGKAWDGNFRDTLTQQGRAQLAHWQRRGNADGLAYGRGLELSFAKYQRRISSAFDNFQGLNVDDAFLDNWLDKSGGVEKNARELRDQLVLLQREGRITDRQFENSNGILAERIRRLNTMSDAVRDLVHAEGAHNKSIGDMNREFRFSEKLASELNDSFVRIINSSGKAAPKWGNLSHNARQWTLIIGAVTAALPELAGLSSAAGSGLLALGGAAASGAVGVGATISAIVGLNKDLEELPPSLRAARSGFDDFKRSFGDLNDVITERAFADSEASWRSLGATVRGLRPAFGVVGDSVGLLVDELANGLAPGTENFRKLETVVAGSADDFTKLTRIAGLFGEGLLTAFASPELQRSVDELLGWLGDLGQGFSDFTASGKFDDFLRNGRAVFGELGELLATTGGLLDDLVTPESITRLTTFMDNLGVFLDTGGRGILEFADNLNAFGLIADLLATVGTGLEPLREPMAELGEQFARLGGGIIDGVAQGLALVGPPLAAIAGGFAEVLDNVPTEALTVLAGAATVATVAIAGLRGVQALQGLGNLLGGVSRDGTQAASALGRLGAAAGVAAAGVVGLTALNEGAQDFFEGLREYDSNTQKVVDSSLSLRQSWDLLGGSALGTKFNMDLMSESLDQVQNIGGDLDQFFPSLGALFTDAGRQAGGLAEVLTTLSPALADVANVDLEQATGQFSAWATEIGATDQQVLNMLEKMPEFRDVLEAVAIQADGTATDQDILNLALGRGADAATQNKDALTDMGNSADLTKTQVDNLADAIRNFGSDTLSARDAERQYEQAVDDLTQSLVDNGSNLDITTAKGRANEQALDDLAKAALESAAAKAEMTGSEEQAAGAISKARDELVRQLGQLNITGQEAEAYADKLGLIPEDVETTLAMLGVDTAQNKIDAFISNNNGRRLTVYQDLVQSVTKIANSTLNSVPRTAVGGMFDGAQVRMIAEDGPEAVVPLNRPLSQVDPDVRWLSAIAQGKMGGKVGGGIGSGSSKTIEAGAIVVQGSSNPIATAVEVLDQIAIND